MTLCVRFADGQPDITDLRLSAAATVGSVRQIVVSRLPQSSTSTAEVDVRLLYGGRILSDGELIGAIVFGRTVPGVEKHSTEEPIWFSCMVREKTRGEEGRSTEPPPVTAQPQGFDRLRDAGFSDAEIAQMRAQFRSATGIFPFGADSRNLEDQWMDSTASDTVLTTPGQVYSSLLCGMSIGFFIPIVPLFFFRQQLFSKELQMAIIIGFSLNIVFGIFRLFAT